MSEVKKAKLEEFDKDVYTRLSENNMPLQAKFVPLSESEQKEIDKAFN